MWTTQAPYGEKGQENFVAITKHDPEHGAGMGGGLGLHYYARPAFKTAQKTLTDYVR